MCGSQRFFMRHAIPFQFINCFRAQITELLRFELAKQRPAY